MGHFGFSCPNDSETLYPPENPFKTTFPTWNNADYENNSNIIFISKETLSLLCGADGKRFLIELSQKINSRIELFCGMKDYIRLTVESNTLCNIEEEIYKWKASLLI